MHLCLEGTPTTRESVFVSRRFHIVFHSEARHSTEEYGYSPTLYASLQLPLFRHFRRLPSPLSPFSPRHCATPRSLRRSPVWRARDVIVSTHQWCVSFVCDVEFAPLSLRFSIQNPTRALASLDSPFDGMKAVERCAILLFSHSLVLSYEFVLGEPSTTNSRDSSENSGAASS